MVKVKLTKTHKSSKIEAQEFLKCLLQKLRQNAKDPSVKNYDGI